MTVIVINPLFLSFLSSLSFWLLPLQRFRNVASQPLSPRFTWMQCCKIYTSINGFDRGLPRECKWPVQQQPRSSNGPVHGSRHRHVHVYVCQYVRVRESAHTHARADTICTFSLPSSFNYLNLPPYYFSHPPPSTSPSLPHVLIPRAPFLLLFSPSPPYFALLLPLLVIFLPFTSVPPPS